MSSGRPLWPAGPWLVAGFGEAGRAATRLLRSRGEQVVVWDVRDTRALRRQIATAGAQPHLGGDGLRALDALEGHGAVLKSPGVVPRAPLISAARRDGLPVLDELELAWRASSSRLVAVTGTNGKSTTTLLCRSVLERMTGHDVPLAGNTEAGPPLSALDGSDPWVACEVSSFQLEGSPAFLPDVAVVTNLSEEHVPWHGSMAAYAAAKRRLVVRDDAVAPVAVLNADDRFCAELAEEARARGSRVLTYGRPAGATIRIAEADWDLRDARLRLETPRGPLELHTRLPGAHNAHNLAAAAAVGLALSQADPREDVAGALARARPPAGRWESIEAGQDFTVIVDYAHTPDGVAQVLAAAQDGLRRTTRGRLLTVLGPVGPPDPSKSASIARAAAAGADMLVLTTGSAPGSHRVARIAEMLAAARGDARAEIEVVLERRAAIARAFAAADGGDAVMILGIGALPRLTLDSAGTRIAHDDRSVAHELLAALDRGAFACAS